MIKCQEGTKAVIRSCWGYREGGVEGGLRDLRCAGRVGPSTEVTD